MRAYLPAVLLAALVAADATGAGGLAWCYRTLADVSCYDRPDPEHPDRLVGVATCPRAGGPERIPCGTAAPPEGSAPTPGAAGRDTKPD